MSDATNFFRSTRVTEPSFLGTFAHNTRSSREPPRLHTPPPLTHTHTQATMSEVDELKAEEAKPILAISNAPPPYPDVTGIPGRFGKFGGRYIPETLAHAHEELEAVRQRWGCVW